MGVLFSFFMFKCKEINQLKDYIVYDLCVYFDGYFESFSFVNIFVKWVVVEVEEVKEIFEGMEVFYLVGGDYVVFRIVDGKIDLNIFQYIFG